MIRKPCPGDGINGCLTMIPADRPRCQFCTRTVARRPRRIR